MGDRSCWLITKLHRQIHLDANKCYLLVRMLVDGNCREHGHCNGVFLQFLAQLLDLFLNIPDLGHLAQHTGLCKRKTGRPLA